MKVNEDAVKHAKSLIKDGKYDTNTAWSKGQASANEENKYLDKHSIKEYGKWYLAIDTSESEDTKGRYSFPFGDFKKVYREGVIAAKQRAAQYHHPAVEKAADELLEMIDEREQEKA